jgi:hypothetical protein
VTGRKNVYAQPWGNLEKERRAKAATMEIRGVNYEVCAAVVMLLMALITHAGVNDEILDKMSKRRYVERKS